MQISPTGNLTETSKDIRNTLAKFEDNILQRKHIVNVYAENFSKILANLYIHGHFLPFLCHLP